MTDATERSASLPADASQAQDKQAAKKQSKAEPGPGEQFEIRAAKRERLRAEGWEPYPVQVPVTTTIQAVRERYSHLEADQETDDVVGVAGRVTFLRSSGKLCFVALADGAGRTLQAMISAKNLPGEGHTSLASFKSDVDLGDHLFVHGRVISSRRGELSVMADDRPDRRPLRRAVARARRRRRRGPGLAHRLQGPAAAAQDLDQ